MQPFTPSSSSAGNDEAFLETKLNQKFTAKDKEGLATRRDDLRNRFRSMSPDQAKAMYDKLQGGDHRLSNLFVGRLHHATRNELLGILHNKFAPPSKAHDASSVAKKVVETVRGRQNAPIQGPVSIHREGPGSFLIDFGRPMSRGDVNKALFPDGKVPPGVVVGEAVGEWRLQFVGPGSDLKLETLREFRPEIVKRLLQAPGATAKELSTQHMMKQIEDMQEKLQQKAIEGIR
ncbi:MAG: hypothetical protein HYR60_12830 [Acidobacteria bacterium]|nr:hypothetical protein [Acidobacteriota bacterium]